MYRYQYKYSSIVCWKATPHEQWHKKPQMITQNIVPVTSHNQLLIFFYKAISLNS